MCVVIDENAYRKIERSNHVVSFFEEGARPSDFQVTAAERKLCCSFQMWLRLMKNFL